MSERYNGWTNYETWNYALWLDNDEGSQGYWAGEAESALEGATQCSVFTKTEHATAQLAITLKEDCEQCAEEWMPKQAGPFADAVNAYISEINWHEIAAHYIETVVAEA